MIYRFNTKEEITMAGKEELIALNTKLRNQLSEERRQLKTIMPIGYLTFAMENGDYKPRPYKSKFEKNIVCSFCHDYQVGEYSVISKSNRPQVGRL